MMPVNTVSRDGFVSLINKLDRRYQMPSRNYFSQVAIPQMYDTCVKTVSTELRQVEFYASTTDLWSSRTTEPYMSFTVHFLTQDFELKARCLGVVYFPESHTSENIAHGLREVLASWNLKEENQVSITTDNGANVVKATEVNNWVRLQCFGHRLHLAIENAVKGDERITRAVGLCKRLVGHFSHSWKEKMALKNAQKEHNLPEHFLITECPTRWGSRQKMIQRVLEQQWAISDVLSANRKSRHLVPSWQDLDVLESINQALQPLQEFTDALSGESYVSVSYVKPVLHLMNTSVLAAKEEDSDLTKSIKMKILDYMNSKYDNPATQELLDMTTFMDPRFKVGYISSDKVSDISARVMSEIEATVSKEQSLSNQDHQGPSDVILKKAKKSLGSFFKTSPAPSSVVPSHAVEAELNSYLVSPTIDSEMDPLTWWRLHQVNFPHLSKLARKYLCIPATSSPSERLFSTAGNVVTCQRTCLKPTKIKNDFRRIPLEPTFLQKLDLSTPKLLDLFKMKGGKAERHFLHYKFTALTKADTFPEFSAEAVFDDRRISHFSDEERVWIQAEDWTEAPPDPPDHRDWFIHQIRTLSDCTDSQCSELHVLQRIIGCELEKLPDGSVNLTVFDEYGFDGEDLISFNSDTEQWIDKSPKAKRTKEEWDRQTGRNQFLKHFLKTCRNWISTFNNTKKSSPDVDMFARKAPDDQNKLVLTCLATGFYPRDVQMEIRSLYRRCITKCKCQRSSGIRPNDDQTFQMRTSVKIDRNHKGSYDCLVNHSSLTEPVLVKWVGNCADFESESDNTSLIAVALTQALALALVVCLLWILLMTCSEGNVIYCGRKKMKRTKHHPSLTDIQSNHNSAQAAGTDTDLEFSGQMSSSDDENGVTLRLHSERGNISSYDCAAGVSRSFASYAEDFYSAGGSRERLRGRP
ncbi:E3 SUMO-protein ligase ZBED1-like [Pseudorasbora parva]|uniref:E3 SUMO-protein ligase ZBED1-like n=1 Tax=Pseudorasbora parva TaxID=51549 RepID=UPI00351F1208